MSDLNQLTTEVLRLRCELKLSATGPRQTLLACLCTTPRHAATVNPPNPDPEQTHRVINRPTTTPTEQEPPTTRFTPSNAKHCNP